MAGKTFHVYLPELLAEEFEALCKELNRRPSAVLKSLAIVYTARKKDIPIY